VKIAYLAQDMADAAVAKRVTMLRRGGAEVDLYGFRRASGAPGQVAGVAPHVLGQTQNGALAQRAGSLLKLGATAGAWARSMADADLIVARNLDNLLLAAVARRRLKLTTPLVYELLDVHTLMFGDGPASRLLRALEGRLLRASDAVIISSPAFEREYLARYHPRRPPALLVENKVLDGPASEARRAPPPDGPPWRIGWFGGIRCKPSLDSLSRLIRAHPGLFEVHIRGRFVNPDMGDVEAIIRDSPGMHYHGPYKAPDDLAKIYGEVHFTWAIDFYQEGANSTWLLPNRLYEGGLHGAPPIALRDVETGRWLQTHGLGLLLKPPLEASVEQLLTTMTPQLYRDAVDRLSATDRGLFQWTDAECADLVARLGALGARRG
jgi:succinoglycan biosynthesis protein ExoL